MFLQRLTKWFTKTVSRIVAYVREALTYDAVEREPVMTSATRVTQRSFVSPDYLLPPNWLEDARRLRPQFLAPDETPQRKPIEKRPLEKTEKQQLSGQSLTAGTNSQAARVGTPQPGQPPRQAPPPSQPARAIPLSPADAAAQPDALDDALLRRRLMSLKHLVRLGVYNEGFTSGHTPEQYHYSLGIDGYDDLGEE